ncbi:MAG: multicopper oxidase domain-containing protein [Frankiales bacterium]|nr:multicopper oxidase domain-containing protein [Frankiales bacterium]
MSLSRRQFLVGTFGVGAVAGLAACGRATGGIPSTNPSAVASAEATRTANGRTRALSLTARQVQWDLGGRVVSTWAYGDTVPGAGLHATAGDRVRIAFRNDLPSATSVHWHGLAIRNDMDGVPGVTTPEIAAGGSFDYDFTIPDPGTHWFHPHTGLQLDRGLYAPFIVDDPHENGAYDAEWIIVLDDWTDGVGPSPEDIYAALTKDNGSGGGMMGMGSGSGMGSGMMGMDGGDVNYPLYLVNGKAASDPDVLTAKPGQRVRIRIINASADTIYSVALAGHRLSVTHTDGYPVQPVTTAAIRIGMGERYDAITTLHDGIFPLVAEPVGKIGLAHALIRTGKGAAPPSGYRPAELDSFPVTADVLAVAPGHALPQADPDTTQDIVLSGSMSPYVWTINGNTYDNTEPLTITHGQTGRFRIRNMSMMPHPLHVHGHTFQVGAAGGTGARKDTILVPAMGGVSVDLLGDNPGSWMVHCHNAYHAEAGMMTRLDYTT